MNYNKIYFSLIEKAKNRVLEGYVEKHHIIPKCLGGSDSIDNLVVLTPEEHFLAHLLLLKIYPNNTKLIYAAAMMTVHNSNYRMNNKLFGWLKRKKNIQASIDMKNDWLKNKDKRIFSLLEYNKTEKSKIIKSESMKKVWGNNPERKSQISELQKEYNKKTAEKNKELWKTEEYKTKMKQRPHGSNSSSMKKLWADPVFKEKMLKARKKK